ncbi:MULTISPECIES: hypothetical protein [Vibrio]|uniref:Amino acid ABC transporter substrate-binding protein n=1 Tax=Vibrio genomosp. F6 str. FF-238 TaxID=1191298 RepID=A0A1E5CVR2_9VIBR|nr:MULTISPECIES: hypothetical protein [Vibrio]MDN3696953.1 hypothetical protein [Vibrio cortegadensis]NOH84316.1 hypothetical protein [Vibrio sp. 03-59-1]OEE74069.1 hypothetical protein A130_18190 [Vibrio genomosp. F6 str. FF-238]
MRWIGSAALLFSCSVFAEQSSLTLALPSQKDGGHAYFHDLLTQALNDVDVQLNIITPDKHIPQKRAVKMVRKNQLSLMWLIQTDRRDAQLTPVRVPLTSGLIGKRVLLIPKGAQEAYEHIYDLKDLQRSGLIAGLGINWFDVEVWHQNQLNVFLQDGEWRNLYGSLSVDGEVNYFPRGVNEVVGEAKFNPALDIEQYLLLEYHRDFQFYLSEGASVHRELIEKALVRAKETGLMNALIEKHWSDDFDALNLDSRRIIPLSSDSPVSRQ